MTEMNAEGNGVTRKQLQDVILHDLYNSSSVDYGDSLTPRSVTDISSTAQTLGKGAGRMILEFKDDGSLDIDITTSTEVRGTSYDIKR